MKEIYQQTVEEVLERVNGKKSGLTSEQVKRSREKCGWNELTEGKKKGILQIFFEGAVYFPTAPFLVFIRLICKFCSNGTPILKSAVHSF